MDKYFYFTTSGTTKKTNEKDKRFKYSKEKYFSFIEDILIPETHIEKDDKVLGLTTIKGTRHIHGSNIQSMCRMMKLKFYRNNKDYIFFKNLINNDEITYLFSPPSFLLQTYEYIDFKKIKKIQLVGEKINENIKNLLLNKILDKNQLITNNYGSTETNSIGYKELKDDYFKKIKHSIFEKRNGNYFFYSPYISDDVDGFLIQDDLVFYDDKFDVIGRKSEADYIKKNGKKILLDELKKFLYQKFVDILFIKTVIVQNLENNSFLEDYELHILKEKNSSLAEEKIKKEILNNFYFEYLPMTLSVSEKLVMPKEKTFKSNYL
jgi:hypothetical protein